MSTALVKPSAIVTIGGDTFAARRDSSCKLDSGAVPYAAGPIVLPLLDEAALANLDPRTGSRVTFTASINGGAPRPFNLGLRTRTVDHRAKTVRLDLASDEAILQDHMLLADDITPFDHQASLRALVGYVLGIATPGAVLAAGPDASVIPKWDSTNILVNPNVAASIANWTSTGTSQLVRNSGAGIGGGAGYAAATSNNANYEVWPEASTGLGNAPAIRAGEWYTFSAYSRIASGSATCFARIYWWDDAGGLIGAASGLPVALSSGWNRFSVAGIAPPTAVRASALLRYAGAFGNVVHVDAALMAQGRFVPDYYDGATADTVDYDYGWTGTANASNSTRTALVDAPEPEAFVWQAGQSAWDFLMPLTSAAGMVLWCDEKRVWRLDYPDARALPTQINLSPINTRDGEDILSRDDSEVWCSGVVVKYTWEEGGRTRTATRSAGTPGKVLLVQLNSPDPGPGAASAILARRQGTGRKQDVTAVSIMATTPGMSAQISLPGAPDTIGRITAVDFDLGSGFMTVETAGLVDVTPGDWLATDPAQNWSDTAAALDWKDA